eukprot:SAG22_NODE_1201_length_5182_cov_3.788904_3_plen_48_part_00
MQASWRANMDRVEEAIVAKGGFGWQSFRCKQDLVLILSRFVHAALLF